MNEIRADHRARYQWAAQQLKGARVLDLCCGIGYGSKLLAEAGCKVEAWDIDGESLVYAKRHHGHANIEHLRGDLGSADVAFDFNDAAVCFEGIEHIADPRPMLRAAAAAAPILLCSVPDEDGFPYRQPDGSTVAFHHRHYTIHEFIGLLNECGWSVARLGRQEGPESDVEELRDGAAYYPARTIVAYCVRTADLHQMVREDTEAAPEQHTPAAPGPEHIAILGLGPSLEEYVNITKRLGGKHAFCDEVWGINAVGGTIMCDRIFHMDDVRIQERRAGALPESNIARMMEWLRVHPGPIVTSRAHPDYPGLVEYPLEDVLNHLGHDYFNSTAAYAVAYAIHIGAKRISLFGCDYTYPNAHDAEKGRACVEFWLGVAVARGIKIAIAKSSSLMDALHSRQERLYGYDTLNIDLKVDEAGRAKLTFTEREQIPTAEEIEARYDHSAHPNALVKG
jgi:SAM-dependent methyltransferase